MRIEVESGSNCFLWKFTDWLWKGNIKTGALDMGRAVICVNENNERLFPPSNKTPYLWVGFNDPGDDLSEDHLKAILAFAEAFKSRGLIVHCYGGRNRSSTICYYLMRKFGMSYGEVCSIFKDSDSNVGIRRSLAERFSFLTGYKYEESWIDN